MKKKLSIFFSSFFIIQFSLGQIEISGPACVIPGITYQYNITANWDSATSLNICLTGGLQVNTSVSCQTSGPLSLIKVVWNNATNGSIAISSSRGNANLNVRITDTLQPGKIDTISNTQTINSKDIPRSISCSVASGGSCSPIFAYLWQVSTDKLNWTSIQNASSQNLVFSSAPKTASFFRRKVTETSSGTMAYSNVIALYLNPGISGGKN